MKEPNYSIEVYEEEAIIKGSLSYEILSLLLKICKKEGFHFLALSHDDKGFKLVRDDNSTK